MSTDVPLLKNKARNLTNSNSKEKEHGKTINKISKYNNFNDIYDKLINGINFGHKVKNKNDNYEKSINFNKTSHNLRNDLNISSIDKRSCKKENIIINEIDNNFSKKKRHYYKCSLFNNLNKLTFENTSKAKKSKIYKKYLNNNKYIVCKNESFSYKVQKFNKSNNRKKDNINNINNINTGKSLDFLSKIINVQKNMIIQYKIKEEILKKELLSKMEEINKYKNIILKFLYYLNKDKNDRINYYNKFIILHSQLLKENKIFKDIFLSKKLFIFKQDENIFESFFKKEKERQMIIEKEKTRITNHKKRNNSNEKKNLINRMLNKEKKWDSTLNILKNNSYEYCLQFSSHQDTKNKKKSSILNNNNFGCKKKLCYLHKNNK